MKKYAVFGVEEVYDAEDDYEHANPYPPFCITAASGEEAQKEGQRLLEQYFEYNKRYMREGYRQTGTFIPRLIKIVDESGSVVMDNSSELVRSWPYAMDERSLVPKTIPTSVCFLSYSMKDLPFVFALSRALPAYSLLPWFDLERPDMPNGKPADDKTVRQQMVAGIRSADVFLITISQAALPRYWVGVEVIEALEQKRTNGLKIIGLQISPVKDASHSWYGELKNSGCVIQLEESLMQKIQTLQARVPGSDKELDALMPSLLDRVFTEVLPCRT